MLDQFSDHRGGERSDDQDTGAECEEPKNIYCPLIQTPSGQEDGAEGYGSFISVTPVT